MSIISLLYLAAVFAVGRLIFLNLLGQTLDKMSVVRKEYHGAIEKKGNVYFERNQLEEEAVEIYTLYDMTKEITKNFNKQDAFNVFLGNLRENVSFDECRLIEATSPELKDLKASDECFLFTLKGKRKLLGYLAIRGVLLEEKEKIVILSHQFALALQRIRLYQEIEKLAITDSLTGVYTRRYILERLEEELERSRTKETRLSFLMLDVDYFKRFNDRYGHLAGDQILRAITVVVEANIREIDIVGRYGGEEFCVILPDTDRNGANYVAERIRSSVEKASIEAYDTKVRATVSIGISTFPDDGKEMMELIDKSDWALYRAKKIGRNAICCFGVYE